MENCTIKNYYVHEADKVCEITTTLRNYIKINNFSERKLANNLRYDDTFTSGRFSFKD